MKLVFIKTPNTLTGLWLLSLSPLSSLSLLEKYKENIQQKKWMGKAKHLKGRKLRPGPGSWPSALGSSPLQDLRLPILTKLLFWDSKMLLRPHKYRQCWGGSHLHLLDSLMLPSKHLHSLKPQVIHPFNSLCSGPKRLLRGYDTGEHWDGSGVFLFSVHISSHVSHL